MIEYKENKEIKLKNAYNMLNAWILMKLQGRIKELRQIKTCIRINQQRPHILGYDALKISFYYLFNLNILSEPFNIQ